MKYPQNWAIYETHTASHNSNLRNICYDKKTSPLNGARPVRPVITRSMRIVAVVALCLAGVAAPSSGDSLSNQIADVSKALIKASKDYANAKKAIAKTQVKLPAARAALQAASIKETQSRVAYGEAKVQLDVARNDYALVLTKLMSKQAEISLLQIKVDQFARSVYQQGPTSQWEIVLEAKSPSDLTSRLQTIKAVSQSSAASLDDLAVAKAALKVEADAADLVRQKMQSLTDKAKVALKAAQDDADAAARAKASLEQLLADEKVQLAKSAKAMAAEQKELDKLIAEQERVSQISNSGSHGNGDPEATGNLAWPVPGYGAGRDPVQHVGPRVLSDGRHSCHTGQDIPAPTGARLLAPRGGVVLFAAFTWGYGNLTLIDHGGGLVTAYAHQSKLYVSKGDTVTTGELIGLVGNTGAFSRGSHLHFEVHVNGYNYDPMGWFGGSRDIVACAPTRSIG